MNKKVVFAALLMLTALADSALAKRISINGHSQDQVRKWCGNTGVFWPSGGTTSTYGCMKPGGGIVCSGDTPKDKQTCDTWMKVPPRLFDHFKALSTGAEKQ